MIQKRKGISEIRSLSFWTWTPWINFFSPCNLLSLWFQFIDQMVKNKNCYSRTPFSSHISPQNEIPPWQLQYRLGLIFLSHLFLSVFSPSTPRVLKGSLEWMIGASPIWDLQNTCYIFWRNPTKTQSDPYHIIVMDVEMLPFTAWKLWKYSFHWTKFLIIFRFLV